jgi:hypothetical protein
MPFGRLLRLFYGLRNALRGSRKPKRRRPPDPRVDADPWLFNMLEELGERYRLGADLPNGIQVLRRTARTRFNPMRVYLTPADRAVLGDYDVRVREGRPVTEGRSLLERRVTTPLRRWGLRPVSETIEEWGGQVITCRYQGLCPDPLIAAAAVRFMCEESEQVMDVTAEE